MNERSEISNPWSLNANKQLDGQVVGSGFDTITVTNLRTSSVDVKVFFDGFFKFGLNTDDSHTEPVGDQDILVEIKPASPLQGNQAADGDIILKTP